MAQSSLSCDFLLDMRSLAVFSILCVSIFGIEGQISGRYYRPTIPPVGRYYPQGNRGSDAGRYKPSNDGKYRPSDDGKYRPGNDGRYIHKDVGGGQYQGGGGQYTGDGGKYTGDSAIGGKYVDDSSKYVSDDSGKYKGQNIPYTGGTGDYSGDGGKYKQGPGQSTVRTSTISSKSGFADSLNLITRPKIQGKGTAEGGSGWRIIRDVKSQDEDGYHYLYETENGILAEESGKIENVGTDLEGLRSVGFYEYTGDDGQLYRVEYVADTNGFVPRGDHIPKAPPHVERLLNYLATQSPIAKK